MTEYRTSTESNTPKFCFLIPLSHEAVQPLTNYRTQFQCSPLVVAYRSSRSSCPPNPPSISSLLAPAFLSADSAEATSLSRRAANCSCSCKLERGERLRKAREQTSGRFSAYFLVSIPILISLLFRFPALILANMDDQSISIRVSGAPFISVTTVKSTNSLVQLLLTTYRSLARHTAIACIIGESFTSRRSIDFWQRCST
jgi:hypothetical protein